MSDRAKAIRKLNDDLRVRGVGGRTVVTAGIAALGEDAVHTILKQVSAFDCFDVSNDPYEEHDFGKVNVAGQTIFFKVDYYDKAIGMHSPDPTDPNVTERVMTIMLASEY